MGRSEPAQVILILLPFDTFYHHMGWMMAGAGRAVLRVQDRAALPLLPSRRQNHQQTTKRLLSRRSRTDYSADAN
jgi:hypothetical protein